MPYKDYTWDEDTDIKLCCLAFAQAVISKIELASEEQRFSSDDYSDFLFDMMDDFHKRTIKKAMSLLKGDK